MMPTFLSRTVSFVFLVSLILSPAWGFLPKSITRCPGSKSLTMSSMKTPLVGNGKRFEADPGSSLIVVRFYFEIHIEYRDYIYLNCPEQLA